MTRELKIKIFFNDEVFHDPRVTDLSEGEKKIGSNFDIFLKSVNISPDYSKVVKWAARRRKRLKQSQTDGVRGAAAAAES